MNHCDCDHVGFLRYARRTFINGTIHYCVQCSKCGKVVKTKRHGGRLFIKHSEIPTGNQIHEFVVLNGGTFNE